MTEELKPCPFCGSADIMEGVFYAEGSVEKRGAVRCADCGARAPEVAWRKLADVPAQGVTTNLPRKLTAENGAKAALIGEFHEDFGYLDDGGDERYIKVAVTWDTIKRIWDAAVAHFDQHPVAPAEGVPSEVAAKVRKHVEFLAHNATGLSMCEWDKISNDLLAAADHLDRRSPAVGVGQFCSRCGGGDPACYICGSYPSQPVSRDELACKLAEIGEWSTWLEAADAILSKFDVRRK